MMGLFGVKRPKMKNTVKKDIYCHFCGKKLGKVIGYGEEVDDGTDDIYDVCTECAPHFEELLLKKGEKL